MRSNPQKTEISTLLEVVDEWRKREGWSRETVCQEIVEAHERIGGPATTGLRFEPPATDTYERQKVNAERIFRWLDDKTKDRNLLPVNFLPSILAALPIDLFMKYENSRLQRHGVELRLLEVAPAPMLDVTPHVHSILREYCEATSALVSIGPGATVADIKHACRELQEAQDSAAAAKRDLQSEIARRGEGANS